MVAAGLTVTVGAAGPASATSSVATTVVTSIVQMTNTPSSQTPAWATCPSGSILVGGGIDLGPASPGATYTNGLKINGIGPGDPTDVAKGTWNGVSTPPTWTALGGFGGQSDANDDVTASAICATGGPSSTTAVVASVVGTTTNPAAGFGPVTATCPAGTSLLSGGGNAVPVADGSLKPIASYPSDSAGHPVAAGTMNPDSWSVFSRNSSAGGPTDGFAPTTTAYALCARQALTTTVVETSTALTTATSSVTQSATAACPANTALISGGVDIDDGTPAGGPSQFGVHLIQDDATDARGDLVTGGGAPAWTATAHTGGIAATVGVHAFALCTPTTSSSTPPKTDPPTSVVHGVGPPSGSKPGAGKANATTTTHGGTTTTAKPSGAPTSVGATSTSLIAAPTVPPTVDLHQTAAARSGRHGGGSSPVLWVLLVLVAALVVGGILARKQVVALAYRVRPRRS
jgi:hypothetical protein